MSRESGDLSSVCLLFLHGPQLVWGWGGWGFTLPTSEVSQDRVLERASGFGRNPGLGIEGLAFCWQPLENGSWGKESPL